MIADTTHAQAPCRYSFNNFIFYYHRFSFSLFVAAAAARALSERLDIVIIISYYCTVGTPVMFPGTYVNGPASCVYCGTSPWWIVNHGHDGIIIIY